MLNSGKMIIRPGGAIVGGHLEYTMDSEKGTITYSGEVVASAMFFSKTLPINGVTRVDPSSLLSANIKPGQTFNFINLKVTVATVKNAKASCSVLASLADKQYTGVAVFGLDKDIIDLRSLYAAGTYWGFSFVLDAVEA